MNLLSASSTEVVYPEHPTASRYLESLSFSSLLAAQDKIVVPTGTMTLEAGSSIRKLPPSPKVHQSKHW